MSPRAEGLRAALGGALTLAYPLVALAAARRGGAAGAVALLTIALSTWLLRGWRKPGPTIALVALAAVAAALDESRLALAWPVLVSAALLLQFARSLASVPIVERFARRQHPDLSEAERAHCRTVTKMWCGFLAGNGITAAVLAIAGAWRWWALYTGVVAYVLMGLLFFGEYVVRKRRFGGLGNGFVDRVLARWLTPTRSPSP